jgi:low temperature requirement protein LtrA
MSSRFARPQGEDEQRTTSLELFYDLVFVFAITQISHHLLEHLTWVGAGQSTLRLLVVWWSWNYTAWVTNELDPESTVVRLLMIALMLASLMMAVAIPHAFGEDALLFVLSYLAIQLGRHGFLSFVAWPRGTVERERAQRILLWFAAAGVFWVAGALAPHGAPRTILWLIALVVDYAPPLFVYWVPTRPRLPGTTWMVETAHFSERFGLFIIIALGESIVVTGATTSELGLTNRTAAAFATAFLTSAALWWLYFTVVARTAERRLHEATTDRTAVARDGYTYLHVVLVGAIVLSAVGDELVIAHPAQTPAGSAEVAAIVGGPALYLLGHVLFRLRLTGGTGWRRPLGALACALIGVVFAGADALVLALLVLAVLVAVIVSDQVAAHRGRAAAPA